MQAVVFASFDKSWRRFRDRQMQFHEKIDLQLDFSKVRCPNSAPTAPLATAAVEAAGYSLLSFASRYRMADSPMPRLVFLRKRNLPSYSEISYPGLERLQL